MNRGTRLILLSVVVGVSVLLAGCFLISVDPAGAFTVRVGSTVYEYETTLDFGLVNPDGDPSVLAAELLNIADRDITVTGVTVDNAAFSVETSEELPFTVLAGESISASLTFDPPASGVETAVLSAVIDGADLPFVLNLSGEGNYPPVANAIVVVSGAGTDEVNGTYYRTDEIEDGCPVYRLTGTEYRIYRYSTEVSDWFIDDDFVRSPAHYENGAETFTAPNGTTEDWWLAGNGVEDSPSSVGEIASSSDATHELPEGDEISPNYLYSDEEEDSEGATLYQWYWADAPAGTYVSIPGATISTYTVGPPDDSGYLKVLVTPVAADGSTTGEPVWFGPSPRVDAPGGEAI